MKKLACHEFTHPALAHNPTPRQVLSEAEQTAKRMRRMLKVYDILLSGWRSQCMMLEKILADVQVRLWSWPTSAYTHESSSVTLVFAKCRACERGYHQVSNGDHGQR